MKLKDPSLFRQQCYIDGKWTDADSGKTIPVNNPATGEILGTVPNMGTAETRRAIEAANAAWPAWRAKTAKERAEEARKLLQWGFRNFEEKALFAAGEAIGPVQLYGGAKGAVEIIFRQDIGDPKKIAERMKKGAFDLDDLSDQLKQLQKLGGMGGIMGVGTKLMAAGLGMNEMQGVTREIIAYAREKAGEDAVGEIVGSIPGLGQFI